MTFIEITLVFNFWVSGGKMRLHAELQLSSRVGLRYTFFGSSWKSSEGPPGNQIDIEIRHPVPLKTVLLENWPRTGKN